MREDLEAASTLASFRFRLHGVTGVTEVWRQLSALPAERLAPAEVWIYGCELVREFGRAALVDDPDHAAREALLAEVLAAMQRDLDNLAPTGDAWLAAVRAFYAAEGTP